MAQSKRIAAKKRQAESPAAVPPRESSWRSVLNSSLDGSLQSPSVHESFVAPSPTVHTSLHEVVDTEEVLRGERDAALDRAAAAERRLKELENELREAEIRRRAAEAEAEAAVAHEQLAVRRIHELLATVPSLSGTPAQSPASGVVEAATQLTARCASAARVLTSRAALFEDVASAIDEKLVRSARSLIGTVQPAATRALFADLFGECPIAVGTESATPTEVIVAAISALLVTSTDVAPFTSEGSEETAEGLLVRLASPAVASAASRRTEIKSPVHRDRRSYKAEYKAAREQAHKMKLKHDRAVAASESELARLRDTVTTLERRVTGLQASGRTKDSGLVVLGALSAALAGLALTTSGSSPFIG